MYSSILIYDKKKILFYDKIEIFFLWRQRLPTSDDEQKPNKTKIN